MRLIDFPMTREEAIRILDPETTVEALAEIEYYHGLNGASAKVNAVSDACVLAVAALRELEEREKPLTLDELQEMDGEKIFVHYIDGFYNDEDGAYFGKFEQLVQEYNGRLTSCEMPIKYYGKTWLAYRRKQEKVENVPNWAKHIVHDL